MKFWDNKYLTMREIIEFRGILISKKRKINNDIASIKNRALFTDDTQNNGNGTADAVSDNSLTFGMIENKRTIIREIDMALERIENGTYGICQSTGDLIPKSVLRSTPWAKYSYME